MRAKDILQSIKGGKRFIVKSYTKSTYIDAKCVKRWENAGFDDLLSDEGDGLRMRTGKSSVYLFNTQYYLV